MSSTTAPVAYAPAAATRWVQLVLGLVCMMAISSPQYVWTLFTKPLGTALTATPAAIQVTFSILIVLQTFFSPFQGWLIERFGPKLLISFGCALTGLSWVLAAQATSLVMLYLTYGVLAGLGTGIVYVGVVGLMVRWFPDRRGFAAGMVAAGYGMGAIATNAAIIDSLAAAGYQATLVRFGLILGVVGAAAALGLKSPPAYLASQAREAALPTSAGRDYTTAEMLRTPIFWLMFLMMTLMSTTGLMVTSQIATFASDFGGREDDGVRHRGDDADAKRGPGLQRVHAAVLRLGIGPDRAGEHDGPGLRARGLRDDRVAHDDQRPGRVRADVGVRVLRLGRNLLVVPIDADGHVRRPLRHQELRLPVYRPGNRRHLRRPLGVLAA